MTSRILDASLTKNLIMGILEEIHKVSPCIYRIITFNVYLHKVWQCPFELMLGKLANQAG